MNPSKNKKSLAFFSKSNYKWMLIGAACIIIGMILMSGGKSPNPDLFDPNEVYSFRRITLAPIVIIIGFVMEIYAIFKKD